MRDDDGGRAVEQQVSSCSIPSMSRWFVGSSSSSNCGSSAMAAASAARLRSPPERLAGEAVPSSPKRCRYSTSRASARQRVRSSSIASRPTRAAAASRNVSRGGNSGSCSTAAMRSPAGACIVAVVEWNAAEDRAEQRRLAGAVAADQADAFAGIDREVGAVEQGLCAKRKFGSQECDQRHKARTLRRNRQESLKRGEVRGRLIALRLAFGGRQDVRRAIAAAARRLCRRCSRSGAQCSAKTRDAGPPRVRARPWARRRRNVAGASAQAA